MNSGQLIALFPTEKELPVDFQVTEPIRQNEFLSNGELRYWDGTSKEVL